MKKHIIFLPLVFAAAIAAAAEVSDAEYAKLREAALNRPRRIFADNDGCDVTFYPKNQPLTKEGVTAYMNGWIKGCEVDVLTYAPSGIGLMMSFPTKIGDRYDEKRPAHWKYENYNKQLEEMGTDGLQLAVEFARANNIEILANMRINDWHERWMKPENHAPYKRAHRELLIGDGKNSPPYGTWVVFDYSHKVVRDRFRGVCNEMISNYDVDGLIVDCLRSPMLFPSTAAGGSATKEEAALITQLVRDLRADCDAAGKKSGRYKILTLRVPDSVEVCRALGIDLDTICKEKLIDFLVIGSSDGWHSTRADAVRIGKSRGVTTYLAVDARDGGSPKQVRNDKELYAALASAAFAGGADGLYYFNCFYHKWLFKDIRRDPRALRFANKTYWGRYYRLPDYTAFCDKTNELAPRDGTDLVIEAGKPGVAMIEIGDDFTDPEVAARKPEAELTVHTAPGMQRFNVSVNGHKLGEPVVESEAQHFEVPVSALRKGENLIEIGATGETPPVFEMIFTGKEIVCPPWRRIWPFYVTGKTEQVVDGDAVRLNDYGTEQGCCMNLHYPLPASVAHVLECKVDLMVENSTAPEAVMVRLANGKNVEVVTFGIDKIGFKFAGKSCKFLTADKFHTYHFRMKDGRLELFADGKKLLEADRLLAADDPKARFTGNNDGLPHMYDRSLIFGSISEPGTGSALWKNLYLRNSAMTKGVELRISFPEIPDQEIIRAVGQKMRQVADFSVKSGVIPGGWRSGYATDHAVITPQKTLRLDNTDPAHPNALISCNERDFLKAKSGILRVSWRATPIDAGNAKSCFQVVVRPETTPGNCAACMVSLRPGALISPWKTIALASGESEGEIYYNFATRAAAVAVDGKIVAHGKLPEYKAPAMVFFGDGGSSCGGVAEVESIKIETTAPEETPYSSSAFARFIGKPGTPIAEFSVKSGKIPDGWRVGYADGRTVITQEKTLRIDNNDPDRSSALISCTEQEFLKAASGILRITWQVTPGDPAGKGSSFQLCARTGFGVAGISLAPGKLITQWKTVGIKPGQSRGELYIDLAGHTAAVAVGGRIVAEGALKESTAWPLLYFGDGGIGCGGTAEIDFVRVERIADDVK